MKKLITILTLAIAVLVVQAAPIYRLTLTWNHSPSAIGETNGHYIIYQSIQNGPFVPIATVPQTTNSLVVTNESKKMAFRVTYANPWGESEPSNELKFPPFPEAPSMLTADSEKL